MGESDIVDYLVENGADVEALDELGNTALYFAVRGNKAETIPVIVNKLLLSGADPNRELKSRYGTVFAASIRKGSVAVVRRLLDAGAKVEGLPGAWTSPLIEAASVGDPEITEVLVRSGAAVDFQNVSGHTAIIVAADCGNVETLKLLLKLGASPDVRTKKGETAVTLAADRLGNCSDRSDFWRFFDIVQLLVEFGGNINHQAPNGWTPLEFIEYGLIQARNDQTADLFRKAVSFVESVGGKKGSVMGQKLH